MPKDPFHDVGVRIQCLALLQHGVSVEEVSRKLKVTKGSIYRFRRVAVQRGFNAEVDIRILLKYCIDAPRSGRPSKQTEAMKSQIIEKVTASRGGREQNLIEISTGLGISASTTRRILKRAGFQSCKRTLKPGLTKEMKESRFQFALRYEHWTLEDWKNVIWSDETAVVLGSRRGRVRVWRRKSEQHHWTVVGKRWKKAMEFMFWGCFSYDKKGPCYIWPKETKAEKDAAEAYIDQWNTDNKPRLQREWEITTGLRRMGLRNLGGPKPRWRFTKKTGRMTRTGGEGIDWWRYQQKILKPLLIPFAQDCQRDRPDTIVQEDKAPAHASQFQEQVFVEAKVPRLLWCGNSPDLNMIEPCWPYLKYHTTKRGAPSVSKTAKDLWLRHWAAMEQQKIQRWIERIPYHIKNIIKLKGGNEYPEGRHFI